MAFTIFFFFLFLKKLKKVEKPFFFRAKNATETTLRSGPDYCWLYCGRNHFCCQNQISTNSNSRPLFWVRRTKQQCCAFVQNLRLEAAKVAAQYCFISKLPVLAAFVHSGTHVRESQFSYRPKKKKVVCMFNLRGVIT